MTLDKRTKITEAKCPDHGVRRDFSFREIGSGLSRVVCDIPNCNSDLVLEWTPDTTEATGALHILLRCFVRGVIDMGYNAIDITCHNRRARIVHLVDKNTLWVCNVNTVNDRPDYTDLSSKFELDDPRSIPAAIRSLCRRLGQRMPNFDEIDEVLDKRSLV